MTGSAKATVSAAGLSAAGFLVAGLASASFGAGAVISGAGSADATVTGLTGTSGLAFATSVVEWSCLRKSKNEAICVARSLWVD